MISLSVRVPPYAVALGGVGNFRSLPRRWTRRKRSAVSRSSKNLFAASRPSGLHLNILFRVDMTVLRGMRVLHVGGWLQFPKYCIFGHTCSQGTTHLSYTCHLNPLVISRRRLQISWMDWKKVWIVRRF